MPEPLWSPSADDIEHANLTRFMRELPSLIEGAPAFHSPEGYAALWQWSVDRPDLFWPAVWKFTGVVASDRGGRSWDDVIIGGDRMAPPDGDRGPRWFTGARLNFAENLLRWNDDGLAIIAWGERGRRRTMTHAELLREVAVVAAELRALGVGIGDRIAGFLPNVPETIVAMLAATTLGATWTSCSPDFGTNAVLDRFGQVEPKVLVCADGYRYAGKEIDVLPRVAELVDRLPTLQHVFVVPNLGSDPAIDSVRGARRWPTPSEETVPLEFAPVPFDHPLYIMYSSGTTGLPKCMIHGAGGTLLQHLKELVLHTDLTRRDRIFYFTTCGWMMWNWLVSSLATGAAIVLYDGSPLHPASTVLWDMAASEGVTVFGTSAKYIALLEKSGAEPGRTHDLKALRTILSTGSPLAEHSYDYVYSRMKPGVRLSSISGGTDLISCFALGNPIQPVWRGELQTRGLGMAVDVWNDDGRSIRGEPGELVCTRPFPSMPVAFGNDPDGSKYRAAYFEHFDGVWRHGDWASLTEHGDQVGLVIYGRSDATLNPGGVRIGTAEIYRQVEQLPEIVESLVIGQEVGPDRDVRVVLFVRLREGSTLDDSLRDRIRKQIRANASPHHVPRKVIQVADIPRTISGKISEIAVRDVVHGRPVKNTDALANPESLELFRNLPQLRE